MKKLSFSIAQSSKPTVPIPKKPSQSFDHYDPKPTHAPRNYVTEFIPSESPSHALLPTTDVIAPLQNADWRRHKKIKNLDLPVSARPDGLQFEPENPSAPAESTSSYGLTLRDKPENNTSAGGGGGSAADELRRFKMDLESLPEHMGMEEFDGIQVEDFGKALLAGYGWKPGQGIGKLTKEDSKVVEYRKPADRHGIGFASTKPPAPKRKNRDREKEKWVESGIRVKVVSKEVKGGSVYLKKGEVVSVVRPGFCDVEIEDGGRVVVVRGVSQDALETVVPRRGGRVLVVSGRKRGAVGTLVERDSERGRGVVKYARTGEEFDVVFDEVAELVQE